MQLSIGIMSVVSDFLLWILGGFATVLAPVGGVVKRNRDRSMKNKRQLQGDPGDPNTEGVLAITHDTRERVAALEEKVDAGRRERRREHEAVMDRIEELRDNDG